MLDLFFARRRWEKTFWGENAAVNKTSRYSDSAHWISFMFGELMSADYPHFSSIFWEPNIDFISDSTAGFPEAGFMMSYWLFRPTCDLVSPVCVSVCCLVLCSSLCLTMKNSDSIAASTPPPKKPTQQDLSSCMEFITHPLSTSELFLTCFRVASLWSPQFRFKWVWPPQPESFTVFSISAAAGWSVHSK